MSAANQPYDFAQAREADARASADQRAAEQFMINCARDYANAESAYRQALAEKIVALKANGTAWTACGDVARGDAKVASLRLSRDIAEGVKEAAFQSAWRASKNRDAELKFVEWSMRRDLAEGHGHGQHAEPGPTFGGRRAA